MGGELECVTRYSERLWAEHPWFNYMRKAGVVHSVYRLDVWGYIQPIKGPLFICNVELF
jgi:hypothetical protein